MVLPVAPATEIGIATAGHVQRDPRIHREAHWRAVRLRDIVRSALEQPRAWLQLQVVADDTQRFRRLAGVVWMQDFGSRVPPRAVRVLAAGVHQADVAKLHRRPLPVEAAQTSTLGCWRGRRLTADRANAPGVIAHAPPSVGLNGINLPTDSK